MGEAENIAENLQEGHLAVFVQAENAATFANYLQRLNRPGVVAEGGIAEAIAYVQKQSHVSTLIVDVSHDAHPLQQFNVLTEAVGPSCAIIVIGDKNDVNFYRELLSEGVVDYLVKPVSLDQLASAFTYVDEDRMVPMPRVGRTIAVTSASGGVGCTTVAACLSQILSEQGRPSMAVVDFDRQKGDLPLLLGMNQVDGLDAILESDNIDPRLLLRTLTRVNERCHLLGQSFSQVTSNNVDNVLALGEELSRLFELSVWDVPAQKDEASLSLLKHADIRLIVTDLTVQSAKRMQMLLRELGDETAGQQIHIVANTSRPYAKPIISTAQFGEFIGHPVGVVLPWANDALAKSLLSGAIQWRQSPAFNQALYQLVRQMFGLPPTVPTQDKNVISRLTSWLTKKSSRTQATL